ncbi:MAG: mechanosensitive ion channel [Rhodobiaceae bacterium]|nr:mechanosensitive ion channel [Rhodobiaceae bacterium]
MKHYLLPILFAAFVMALPIPASAQIVPGQQGTTTEATPSGDPAIESLLTILKDDTKRAALIEQLEKSQTGSATASRSAAPEEGQDQSAPTVARQVADLTKSGVEDIYNTAIGVWRDFSGISSVATALNDDKRQRIYENAPHLLGTIVTTTLLLWIFTRLFSRIAQRLFAFSGRPSLLRSVATVTLNALTDIVALAIAYAVGSALAISVFGNGQVAVEQSLYLNAFVIAGIVRILIRIFVLPDRPEQAVFNFSATAQRAIYRRLVLINGLLAYGVTAATPIANIWISFVAGRSVRVIVVTAAAIVALFGIRHVAGLINEEYRAKVDAKRRETSEVTGDDLGSAVEELGDNATESVLTVWHRLWPWLAAAYVLFAYLIAIAQPSLMTDLIGTATFKTVIAGGILALAFRFMQRASATGMPLPPGIRKALPELKSRLDGFVPIALRFLSIALVAVAAGFLIDAWHVINVSGWISSPIGTDLLWRIVSALLIVSIVLLVWAVISSWIDHRLTLDLEGRNVSARSRTLLSLFRNAFTVAIFVFGAMTALSQLGIDIAPLLAGAGVIGLAIGFGSQKLVQDIITGIFIQLDNAINEGDVVTVGGITGSVEKLTIRSVGLRDIDGTYHIVPFSSVDTVSNFMRKFAYHVAVVGVAYKEKVPKVKAAMEEAFQRLKQTEHGQWIIGDLEMHGVVQLADSSVNVRARIKTRPGKQWALGREFTEIIKEVFDEQGIEIPFPHRQMVYPPGMLESPHVVAQKDAPKDQPSED